jgi:uncharacterized membrane protein
MKVNNINKIRILVFSYILIVLIDVLLLETNLMFPFMILNLALAHVALEIANLEKKFSNKKVISGILIFLWLIFYPNTMYLLTDIIHLKKHLAIVNPEVGEAVLNYRSWIKIVTLLVGIGIGLLSGLKSFSMMYQKVENNVSFLIFNLLVSSSAAFAIYLGRFELRLHSIYLFTEPLQSIKSIFEALFSIDGIFFTLIFGGLIFSYHYFIRIISNPKND